MRFFITGISRGLGLALTKQCVLRGHEVWGVSRSDIPELGEGVRHTKCDLRLSSDIDRVYFAMAAEGYSPDVVVLNAAHIGEDFAAGIDPDVLRCTFEVNILGNIRLLNLIQRAAGHKSIIFFNISSVYSFRAITAGKLSYSASKCAMDMLFDGLHTHHNRNGLHRFITLNLGPLKERCSPLNFFSKTYLNAAQKIILTAEKNSVRDALSYPLRAGLACRMTRLLPNRLFLGILNLIKAKIK